MADDFVPDAVQPDDLTPDSAGVERGGGVTEFPIQGQEDDRSIAKMLAKAIFGPNNMTAANIFLEDLPAFGRGVMRKPEPETSGFRAQAENVIGQAAPQLGASALAAALTGGASIPVQIGAQAAASGLSELGQEAAGGRKISWKEVGKAAAASLTIDGFFAGAGKAFKLARPGLLKMGSQLLRTTSAVPEKYGKAVLDNPAILTEAPSLEVAQRMYKQAIRGMAGAREFLEQQTGDVVMKAGAADDLVNSAKEALDNNTLGLQEALAARQATANLLEMAKFGDPRLRASKRALLEFKGQLDDLLETGIPGFKKATKDYFNSNARAAFSSFFPENRNMSANALRGLGALSTLSAGAMLHSPILLMGAAAASPKFAGYGIRVGANVKDIIASQAAQFAARAGVIQAVKEDEDRPEP